MWSFSQGRLRKRKREKGGRRMRAKEEGKARWTSVETSEMKGQGRL